jgi:5-methylcytosine-specific restriction endonuclease McrA
MTYTKEQRKEYYLKNKKHIKEYAGEYYFKNKERILKRKAVYRTENKEKIALMDHRYINSERGYINETVCAIFTRSRKNDNKNGNRKKWIPECTKQDIYDELMLYIQDHGRNCEYCKKPWTYVRRMGTRQEGFKKRGPRIDTNFSIDRLDSEKTYVPDNLVFCCIGCNNRKNQVRLSDIVNILRVWMPRKIKRKGEYEL